ncbi:hypothetical protein D8B22_02065, partial [Verminephrobacter aporrectodeae subsp. tuberculatae]|nr:hypothetical protein [Verminephrobacter aporrectodeae subsp. tuberculatae]MCW8167949.1 hypothetical protein [Verminephrobacter aporrectodeae subsp. tuberculatae]
MHFEFNDWPLQSSFRHYDCRLLPGGARWTSELTRDPDNAKHYWATLSTIDGETSTGGYVAYNPANLTDDSGTRGADTLFYSELFTVDTIGPRVTSITIDDTRLKAGETAKVRFVFSEKVDGASLKAAIDLSKAHGTLLGDVVTTDGGLTWTAVFAPAANTAHAEDCVIGVNASQVRDLFGNAGEGSPVYSNRYTVSTLGPSLTADAITFGDSVWTFGRQTIPVTLTFSEPVRGLSRANLQVPAGKGTLSDPDIGPYSYSAVWTVLLTAHAGTDANSTNNKVTVDLSGVTDCDGLRITTTDRVESSNTYTIDNNTSRIIHSSRFSVRIQADKYTLGKGESTIVHFEFDVSPRYLNLTQFVEFVPHGTHWTSGLFQKSTNSFWATLSAKDDAVSSGRISVDLSKVADSYRQPGAGHQASELFSIDTFRPKHRSITIDDEHLQAGETATVTFVFTEKVANFQSAIDLSKATPFKVLETDSAKLMFPGHHMRQAMLEEVLKRFERQAPISVMA